MTKDNRRIRLFSALLGWAEVPPVLTRLLSAPVRALARIPPVGRRLGIVARAALGTRAFPMHRIDRVRGRISIGLVDEIMTGSKLLHAMHTIIGQRLDPAENARVLYELGEATTM